MYDKDLFKKICNGDCSLNELKSFAQNIRKQEFDLDNIFEEYYSLDRILLIIEKYQNGQVNDNYLATWAYAYLWMLDGILKTKNPEREVSFKKWIQWEITEWLDSLAFFDAEEEYYDLEYYKTVFKELDEIYQTAHDWRVFVAYVEKDADCGMGTDTYGLAVNAKTKKMVALYEELDCLSEKCVQKCSSIEELKNKINELQAEGYQKLTYCAWDEELI